MAAGLAFAGPVAGSSRSRVDGRPPGDDPRQRGARGVAVHFPSAVPGPIPPRSTARITAVAIELESKPVLNALSTAPVRCLYYLHRARWSPTGGHGHAHASD